MEIYMDMWSLIWIIVIAVFAGCLLGAGIGFYTAEKDIERKQQKVLDKVGVTPYFPENKEFVKGYVVGSIMPIPALEHHDNVEPLGQEIYQGQDTALNSTQVFHGGNS